MKKVEIGFWGVESILEFVSIAGACNEKINLACGDRTVNAKSLLSVLSLATTDGLELIVHEDFSDSLLRLLELYVEHGRLLGSKHIAV
ncbi:PTS HPr component phosphorylation site [Clostridium sp. C105KSO15]|nr:PTS HPr component phosphorylation site [Clostridium sp. C105KSO15]